MDDVGYVRADGDILTDERLTHRDVHQFRCPNTLYFIKGGCEVGFFVAYTSWLLMLSRLRVFAHSYPGSILQDEDAFFHPNQRGGGR